MYTLRGRRLVRALALIALEERVFSRCLAERCEVWRRLDNGLRERDGLHGRVQWVLLRVNEMRYSLRTTPTVLSSEIVWRLRHIGVMWKLDGTRPLEQSLLPRLWACVVFRAVPSDQTMTYADR